MAYDENEDYEDDFEDYADDFEEEEEDEARPPVRPPPKPVLVETAVLHPVQATTVGRRGGRIPVVSSEAARELDLGEELARGAFSRVHVGSWRGMDVAVKVLTDTSAAQLSSCEEELLVHAALTTHPGVVQLHGANLSPPGCCIVLERCASSLFERLHRQYAELDRREAVGMAAQVAEAMAHLHAQDPPIVHRDLKSHNVLLDGAGRCKLCDFGLVRTREVTAGTPNYMAPELFQARPYSTPVDVFAFAVLLNELFAREVPWDGYQPLDIKDKVLAGERPRMVRTMPHACESLVRKGWHQHASIRPPFKQMIGTLRSIEESLPLGAALLDARYGGGGGGGSARYVDALDDFASLGLGRTV